MDQQEKVDSVYVTLFPLSQVIITAFDGDPCNLSGPEGFSSYTWIEWGNNPEGYVVEESSSPYFHPNFPSTYSMYVTDGNGCISFSDNSIYSSCGGKDNRKMKSDIDEVGIGITISPNPFSEAIQISFIDDQMHEVSVFDLTGRKVISLFGSGLIMIERNNIHQGVYVLKTNNGYSEKIIAQ